MATVSDLAGRRVYLDTNLFIYYLEDIAPYAETLHSLFLAIESSRQSAVTSQLTIAELLVKPLREGDDELKRACLRAVRTHAGLTVASIRRAVLVEAAAVRAAHGFGLADSIHASTARLSACDVFLTNDERVRGIPGVTVLLLSELEVTS